MASLLMHKEPLPRLAASKELKKGSPTIFFETGAIPGSGYSHVAALFHSMPVTLHGRKRVDQVSKRFFDIINNPCTSRQLAAKRSMDVWLWRLLDERDSVNEWGHHGR